jgi:hypothetical protein
MQQQKQTQPKSNAMKKAAAMQQQKADAAEANAIAAAAADNYKRRGTNAIAAAADAEPKLQISQPNAANDASTKKQMQPKIHAIKQQRSRCNHKKPILESTQ